MNTKDFQPEIFKLFDDQWGILTAGDKDAFNSMTISWGIIEGFYTKGRVPHTMYIGEIIETIR